jgi:hypothetical protein
MKIKLIPATMAIAPRTALTVIFSWKSIKPTTAAKRGEVEEIGTARESDVLRKL